MFYFFPADAPSPEMMHVTPCISKRVYNNDAKGSAGTSSASAHYEGRTDTAEINTLNTSYTYILISPSLTSNYLSFTPSFHSCFAVYRDSESLLLYLSTAENLYTGVINLEWFTVATYDALICKLYVGVFFEVTFFWLTNVLSFYEIFNPKTKTQCTAPYVEVFPRRNLPSYLSACHFIDAALFSLIIIWRLINSL